MLCLISLYYIYFKSAIFDIMRLVIKMVNYPNGQKHRTTLQTQTSKSNRGQSLEEDLNQTNLYYRTHGIALIHKKPTPIQVVHVEYPQRSKAKITEAYYRTPSTTDYNGVFNGYPIDFEAKQTENKTRIPLKMLHSHQIEHLRQVTKHRGLAFLIIRFSAYQETYLLEFKAFDEYIIEGSAKSVPYLWIKENAYLCSQSYLKPCDYIEGIKQSIAQRR